MSLDSFDLILIGQAFYFFSASHFQVSKASSASLRCTYMDTIFKLWKSCVLKFLVYGGEINDSKRGFSNRLFLVIHSCT